MKATPPSARLAPSWLHRFWLTWRWNLIFLFGVWIPVRSVDQIGRSDRTRAVESLLQMVERPPRPLSAGSMQMLQQLAAQTSGMSTEAQARAEKLFGKPPEAGSQP
ncbi:MAG: hypothetical protein ACREIA_22845 [Opitutaceae bacterium]